jgi:radical SAM protein with 4Fe4S-binding SPASM domain
MVLRRLDIGKPDYRPVYVVWELTLRCDQPCTHCGSRAGDARASELSTDEAVGVARQLAEMRTEEVALIGGEAYLHPGFLDIVRALRGHGVRVTMTTGARGIDAALARALRDADVYSVSVSVDGLEATHDLMRAGRGSFRAATAAIGHLRDAGVTVTANTNFNRLNMGEAEALFEHLAELGIVGWQVQITAPLGRAADRADLVLQPWDLVELVPRLAALKKRAFERGILVMPGNNLGYFGREEALLRSTKPDGQDHFQGCLAGRFLMGIESDGAVKGCPSLQTSHYVGGNVRERSLREIWDAAPELAFTRARTVDDLWGFCRTCPFAETCLGGCSFTAHSVLGRPGNNPYCHFRAASLAREGKRERLVPARPAPGRPFDHGLFEIQVEPWDDAPSPPPTPEEMRALVRIRKGRDGPPLP